MDTGGWLHAMQSFVHTHIFGCPIYTSPRCLAKLSELGSSCILQNIVCTGWHFRGVAAFLVRPHDAQGYLSHDKSKRCFRQSTVSSVLVIPSVVYRATVPVCVSRIDVCLRTLCSVFQKLLLPAFFFVHTNFVGFFFFLLSDNPCHGILLQDVFSTIATNC